MSTEVAENQDTIFALSTPSGSGALAIVRISGPRVLEISKSIVQKSEKLIRSPREQVYSAITIDGEVIDYALSTYFEEERSFTGEHSLELTVHCSRAILRALFQGLMGLNLRQATPGEFSKRAYLNGKLDLAQAEAVLDLINSETLSQVKAARSQLEGNLSKAVDELGEPLRDLLAEIEANIDFPEEDIEPSKSEEWGEVLDLVYRKLDQYISSFSFGKIIREGALIVLAGVPNAGKSSLMNAFLRDERVIVTNVPGTTRDAIEERIELDGILCRLVDTAGLAEDGDGGRVLDSPELLGIEKSKKYIKDADLVVFLFDRGQDPFEQKELLSKIKSLGKKVLLVYSKSDLFKVQPINNDPVGINYSVSDAESLVELEKGISERLNSLDLGSDIIFTNERHRDCLLKAKNGVFCAKNGIIDGIPIDLVSFEVRAALASLSEIIGVTEIENILGRIFSKFCIGK